MLTLQGSGYCFYLLKEAYGFMFKKPNNIHLMYKISKIRDNSQHLFENNVLVYIHSKQYRFFRRSHSVLLPCNPRRTLAGFSRCCMVIVLKGYF